MYFLLTNNRTDFNLLSDDEKTVIISFRNNIFTGDKRNPTDHPINDAWQAWEGKYTNDWRKHASTMTDGKCILKKVRSKKNVAAVAFMTSGYKKAIQEYTRGFKKGTAEHTDALAFSPIGFKKYIINSDTKLRDFLTRANPYQTEGFGFRRIEEFVNDPEYGNHFLPSMKRVEYYAAEGLTKIRRGEYNYDEYYTPLCLGFMSWNEYYHTGYMVMDYMPEYLNMDAWTSIFKAIVRNFFNKWKPNAGLLFNPSEDFEKEFCMKLGFKPAELDPKYDMSEYILYAKDFRDAD